MPFLARIMLIFLLSLSFYGCGLKGKLYLPAQTKANKSELPLPKQPSAEHLNSFKDGNLENTN